jgi:hypothetical protein
MTMDRTDRALEGLEPWDFSPLFYPKSQASTLTLSLSRQGRGKG